MSFDWDGIFTFLSTEGPKWAVNIVSALAILLIGKQVAKAFVSFAKKIMIRSKVDDTLVSFLGNVLYGLAYAFVVIASLSQLGVETTSLAAILAAAGLAIGLSLQSSLSNLAAGVMIIAFRPFKRGDFVELAGTSGTVTEVSIFTTTLNTPDNRVTIVPNGSIISGNITNFSANDTRRIDLVFGASYGDDLKKVKALLQEIVAADERILEDPATTIAVSELADSSVNFVCRPWVKSSDYWAVRFDLIESVKARFDNEGISIPFPQRDVHMHQVEAA
jgi:small conductance mechanosensitive channel